MTILVDGLARWDEAEVVELMFKQKKRQLRAAINEIQEIAHKKDKNELDEFNRSRAARWAVIVEGQLEQLETLLYKSGSSLYMTLDKWEKELHETAPEWRYFEKEAKA